MNPERERAIAQVMAMDVPGSGPLELVRREAEAIVDALLALPDPVRDAARRLEESAGPMKGGHWVVSSNAMERLRAALEKEEQ